MTNIPLIIPNFNQLTYLINLVNWWKFYNPLNPVWVLDNASTYQNLLTYYDNRQEYFCNIIKYPENDCAKNIKHFLESGYIKDAEYYVISDPDIMPHPTTPPNFLEIFKRQIDKVNGYHHVGFQLIIDDLPTWMYKRDWIIGDEKELRQNEVIIDGSYKAWKAPIDTTFALYAKKNGGWASPMSPDAWTNSLRMFSAFHLSWYLDGERLNPEMENYFTTAKYRVIGEPSAGRNNFRPEKFIKE